LTPIKVNGGQRYVEGAITVEDYNGIIEGVLKGDNDAELALGKITNLTAEEIENGGAISANVVTLPDGNLKLQLKNTKGEKGEPGGTALVKQELGQSVADVMSQKVVTDNLNLKANKTEIPTRVSLLTNDSGYDTVENVNAKIANAGGAIIQPTEPTGKAGAVWVNSSNGLIKYWNGTAWVDVVSYAVYS
ncbi:MAG: hypothetical protein RR458_01785, partial [Clostridia bacterium]